MRVGYHAAPRTSAAVGADGLDPLEPERSGVRAHVHEAAGRQHFVAALVLEEELLALAAAVPALDLEPAVALHALVLQHEPRHRLGLAVVELLVEPVDEA